jgi:hypothetical protein
VLHPSHRVTRILGAVGVVAGLSLGAAGIAAASSGSADTPKQVVPSPTSPVPGLPGQDATAQDQANADFTPPGEKAETPDPGEAKGEAKGTEAESANDPEPNHQDPNGANVNHTPAGEKPEPSGTGRAG